MKRFHIVALVVACALTLTLQSAEAQKKANRFFEIRTYTTNDGKLKDLHARFKNHTNRLFKKHGMQLIGYWTPTDKKKSKNTLVYILAYPSMEARTKAWKGFFSDPEWQKAYKNSIKDGRLVKGVKSQYLSPTEYSPIK